MINVIADTPIQYSNCGGMSGADGALGSFTVTGGSQAKQGTTNYSFPTSSQKTGLGSIVNSVKKPTTVKAAIKGTPTATSNPVAAQKKPGGSPSSGISAIVSDIKEDKTVLYVGIGVGVLLVGAIIYRVAFHKKKK